MVTWDDFNKIWASASPLTPYQFSDLYYLQGWNFIGSTPPARQMWDAIQKKNDEKFKYLRDNFGTPNIVTSSSQMTDTEKVYVYMGSEAGWNNGHWYYWNGSAWADGGVYNSVAFVTDTTLSIAGQPADAKATGDALALKSDLAGCIFTGDVSVNADFTVTGTSTLGDVTASSDLSVAGDSALTNLSVSGTTALAGTSTAPTPSAGDNSTKIATTEYVQNEVKPIETDVDIADKRISNIEKLLQGNLYDYQTDSTSAYIKSVPSGAMPYAGLEKVGGKTIAWNQLSRNTLSSRTYAGVTCTNNGDGTFTVNGTAIANMLFDPNMGNNLSIINGHKYLWRGCPTGGSLSTYYLEFKSSASHLYAQDTGNGQIFTSTETMTIPDLYSGIYIANGFVANNIVFKPQLIDLTLAFGSGNEPTLGQCKALFPADFYPYNAGTLLSAGVTEVVSKDSNDSTLQTYSIPASIQALEGYGWSAGTAYNYVDFERKVFVQNVGSRAYASGDESDSTVITDGTTTYYPLTTAVETDISEYLTDDNLISVESGGTLTFPNSNGTDYQIPVPSEEEYMIDLQSAIGG